MYKVLHDDADADGNRAITKPRCLLENSRANNQVLSLYQRVSLPEKLLYWYYTGKYSHMQELSIIMFTVFTILNKP